LQEHLIGESRGTGGWHVGQEPDERSQETALNFGVDISDLRARQFSTYDFELFDHILVMDEGNYRDVVKLASSEQERSKVKFLLDFAAPGHPKHVPDPYYGGQDGFVKVFKMIHNACEGLVTHLTKST
jgi:protein-tyrosine phosphatase